MKTKFVLVFGLLCLTPWMARAVSIYTWQGNSSSLFSCTFQVEDSKLVDGEIARDDITDNPKVVTPDANVTIVFKFNNLHLFLDPQGNIVSGSFTVSDSNNIGGVAIVFGSATNLTENSYVGGQLVNTYTEDGRWITSHIPDTTATLWPTLLVSGVMIVGHRRLQQRRT